jgi:hypothetical protein
MVEANHTPAIGPATHEKLSDFANASRPCGHSGFEFPLACGSS